MAAQSSTKALDVFSTSKKLVIACYALTASLPAEEKTNLVFYIRNAALSAHLAISQGIFLKKRKRKRKFLQKAKDAFVVIDAAVEILVEVGLTKEDDTKEVIELSSICYQQIDTVLKKCKR